MRRIDDERGGIAVTVAILLVVMIGLGALVLDVGNLYWERRQLQNSADASALAAAQDLVVGESMVVAEASARTYTSANNTRDAYVDDIFQPTTTSVTVETITGDADGSGTIASFLASILGVDNYFTHASATAAWGGIAGAATIPIAICEDAWNHLTNGGQVPPDEPFPFSILRIGVPPGHLNAGIDCSNPGGGDVPPGGFGFLDADGNCQAHVAADGWSDGKTGNTPDVGGNSPCTATDFYNVLIDAVDNNTKLLIPIFDEYAEQGAAGRYHIIGFGALELRGYTINAGPQHPTFGRSYGWTHGGSACPGSASCLDLRFTDLVSLGADVIPGDGTTEFGASLVRLIE